MCAFVQPQGAFMCLFMAQLLSQQFAAKAK